MSRSLPLAAALVLLGVAFGPARAQGPERPAVDRGVAFLKSKVPQMKAGEAGLATLSMIKAEVPIDDPGLLACMARFGSSFSGTSYSPEARGGIDNYEAAVVLVALVNVDPVAYKPQIEACAKYLIGKQMGNGGWDYAARTAGDTSMTQYALLGLWEAENAGVVVPPNVWDKAARWFLASQSGVGSWSYHRDEAQYPETISMTAAGVGSLMICQRQLARHRKGQDLLHPLMVPLIVDGQAAETRYKVETAAAAITNGIGRGVAWLSGHFQISTSPVMGQSPYYGLYGIERLAALGDKATIGNLDWYNRGLEYILSTQQPSGAWNAQHDEVPNTCWAILFSVKSTQKSIRKINVRRLGAGTLRGGRGLPSDLSNMEIVHGQVVVRPMGGAIDGMLAVLEDPRAANADSALAGLVDRYQAEGPKTLRPLKDRFRKLLNDPDPSIRRVAVWGLGRTADLDVAPLLIRALLDADDEVVGEARIGLQVLSRKLDGFGPAPGASPEERQAAARRWQAWFDSVKPPDLDAPDGGLPAGTARAAASTAKVPAP